MKIKILGGGQVSLSKRDFVGSGGEGSVYVRGSTAYKIYANPKKMIPEQKIEELSKIRNKNVIKPLNVLLDSRNKPVGYSMRFVKDASPICQLFTKAYKKRNGIGPDDVFGIVRDMQDGLEGIHSADVLVVDLNEMNLLLKGSDVFWIDVDSYQTKSYPATAIMDSIRDWQAKSWTRETDWFSWGIVTFQLFTGIHPFKGKHPSVKKMADRMLQNLSVFNDDVKVPKMVPSFETIPEAYRRWYKAVFEDGRRVPPPKGLGLGVVFVAPRNISSTDRLKISEVFGLERNIFRYDRIDGFDLIAMDGSVVCLTKDRGTPFSIQGDGCFGHTSDQDPLYGRREGGEAYLVNAKTLLPVGQRAPCQSMMAYDGRFYIHYDENVIELMIRKVGNNTQVFPHPVANVMPMATQLFDGVAIQNMLGSWYASVFPGSQMCNQVRLKELDGYRIVDAKHDHRVMIVIGTKNGQYDKFVYRFERDYVNAILFWKDEDVAYSGINFVTLDKGVCAHIDEVEDLVLFGATPTVDGVKRISDPMIGGDMRLFKRGNEVLFARGSQLFKLSMRN